MRFYIIYYITKLFIRFDNRNITGLFIFKSKITGHRVYVLVRVQRAEAIRRDGSALKIKPIMPDKYSRASDGSWDASEFDYSGGGNAQAKLKLLEASAIKSLWRV